MGVIKIIGTPLYQWELGRKISISTSEHTIINKVEFSHDGDTESLVVKPRVENDQMVVDIPNIMLLSGRYVHVYISYSDENLLETVAYDILPVIKRPKPSDYVYTETEVLTWESLDERIKKLEKSTGGADISKEDIQDAVNEYLDNNPVSFNETDPTVPDWAKQPSKPTYTASEVKARPDDWMPSAADIGAQPVGNYATKDEIPVVPDIPTTLPNPHKLTFSGAVSAEYDGSKEVIVKIPEGGSGGGSEWTKIGEVTLTGKNLPITAVADNMIIVDTTNGGSVDNKNIVVRNKDYSALNAVRLNSTDVAGQYVVKNLDLGTMTVDESWVGREIEIPDAGVLKIAIGGKFNYLKIVVTTPAIMFHGSRTGFTFGYAFMCPGTVHHFGGCPVIYEAETMPCPVDGYIYVQGMWRGGDVGVRQTYSEMRMVKKAVVPAEFSMGHYNGLLTIGTKVELWGKA